jgi:hypothetical protein
VRIAVLTLTRDRLAYTQHCFAKLHELAGCGFDHYVLDQGSEDGTPDWLTYEYDATDHLLFDQNIGCCKGWNTLLREACDPADYDAVVCFDNDCELIQPSTLQTVAHLAVEHNVILSPRVMGLRNPPPTVGEIPLGDHAADETTILGNIFMAIPASLLTGPYGYRWNEAWPVWAGGEAITDWHRQRGGRCGYLVGYTVNHYKTTVGQATDIPWYFERRVAEGGPAL